MSRASAVFPHPRSLSLRDREDYPLLPGGEGAGDEGESHETPLRSAQPSSQGEGEQFAGTRDFYDGLAASYHLIYEDWEGSMAEQARALDVLIREFGGRPGDEVLDVACGIGTQALGLAARGYSVTASDISVRAIVRARREALRRGLDLELSVADMRRAHEHHASGFDVVLCADNALLHLLKDTDILEALRQFRACLRPGGACVISVRDYAEVERSGTQVKPYGLRRDGAARCVVFQVWEWREPYYDLSLYLVRDALGAPCRTEVFRSTVFAMSVSELVALMERAGFDHVERRDDVLFQPVIVGVRAAATQTVA